MKQHEVLGLLVTRAAKGKNYTITWSVEDKTMLVKCGLWEKLYPISVFLRADKYELADEILRESDGTTA